MIAGLIDGVSRSHVQGLFDIGGIRVNGQQCTAKNFKISEGDVVEVTIPDPVELNIEAENIPLDIVYEDNDVLVINKPRGMTASSRPLRSSVTASWAAMAGEMPPIFESMDLPISPADASSAAEAEV